MDGSHRKTHFRGKGAGLELTKRVTSVEGPQEKSFIDIGVAKGQITAQSRFRLEKGLFLPHRKCSQILVLKQVLWGP
jgi:hypothetical protein